MGFHLLSLNCPWLTLEIPILGTNKLSKYFDDVGIDWINVYKWSLTYKDYVGISYNEYLRFIMCVFFRQHNWTPSSFLSAWTPSTLHPQTLCVLQLISKKLINYRFLIKYWKILFPDQRKYH